ncbi:LysM domain-containing protein [Lactobacillus sp. XV13L]|nr:LysM domain-containing protein [Lactobacillus sp. XV13L]
MVPVGYYLASNLITDKQVVNVQKKVKKHAPAKSASSAKGQTKTKAKAKAPSKPKTKIKTAAQPQKGPQSKAKKTAGAKKYTVKVGESLTGIAQDHHMTVSKLAQLNDLDVNSRVEIGQVLKLK